MDRCRIVAQQEAYSHLPDAQLGVLSSDGLELWRGETSPSEEVREWTANFPGAEQPGLRVRLFERPVIRLGNLALTIPIGWRHTDTVRDIL